jgi:hypothetical protein
MFFPLRMMLEEKALKARPIKAIGAAHGLDHKSCFWVLADMISIEEIGVRQNGKRTIFFNHKAHEGCTKGQKGLVFLPQKFQGNSNHVLSTADDDTRGKSAEGATYKSHGCSPWFRS